MSFPLFQSAGSVAFLDDDPDYLEMLALVLPANWNVKFYLRPTDFINKLQQEPPAWETDAWDQQRIIDAWRAGTPLIPQILEYWETNTRRYDLVKVCVVDYSMPAMDGLQVLGELVNWPGSRILLTGQADEQVAVNAFNRGLIEQFIAKQSSDVSKRLIDAVHWLMSAGNARHSQIWRSTLSPEQTSILRVPSVTRDLSEKLTSTWVEHVVIGAPFGIIGIDAHGAIHWLALETVDGLRDLADLATAAGMSSFETKEIAQGRKLPDIELRQSLQLDGAPQLRPAIPIGREGTLLGALFTLPEDFSLDQNHNYGTWLESQPPRIVQD